MKALILIITLTSSIFAYDYSFKNSFSNLLLFLERDCIIYNEPAYVSCYNENYNRADFVVYQIDNKYQNREVTSRPAFFNDPRIEKVDKAHYNKSGYDKGHLAFHRAFVYDKFLNQSLYNVALNIVPMLPRVNRGQWRKIETIALKEAREQTVDVIDIVIPSPLYLPSETINIPKFLIKVIITDANIRWFRVSKENPESNNKPEKDCNIILDILNKEFSNSYLVNN